MRYAIIGATAQQVKAVGGIDIKDASRTGIIFATLTPEQAARLRSLGCQVNQVGQVKADVMPPIVTPPVPVAAAPVYTAEQLAWAAGFEELRALISPPLYGQGINLAIIDSGIRETHEKINGRVVYRKNFTSDPMRDGLNHGTGVCSIALTIAPLCNILNIKVLNDKGMGTEEDVVMGIDDLLALYDKQSEYAPRVINLSLGSQDDGNPYNPMRIACRAAIERGIWVVAAAGNEGPQARTIMCPACDEWVDAVGSVSYEPFKVSDFSGRGPTKEGLTKPDEVMFGENIMVASSSSDTDTIAKSGTSFSTPFISGFDILFEELMSIPIVQQQAAKLLVQYGYSQEALLGVSPKQLAPYLSLVCIKPEGEPPSKDNNYGYGLMYGPNLIRLMGLVKPVVDISELLSVVTPLLGIGMLGMMMAPMVKAWR